MTEADLELFARAEAAAGRAYAPYSRFEVGAALRSRGGLVVEGANVENGAYPLGICAEQGALARAVVEGVRPGDVEALAVTAAPCGGCRQWLAEFRVERVVYRDASGELVVKSPDELLPDGFRL